MSKFDYNAAIKAGYSDDEIKNFLGGFDYKAAINAGYSTDEMDGFLSSKTKNLEPQTQSHIPSAPTIANAKNSDKSWLDNVVDAGKKTYGALIEPVEYVADNLVSLATGKSTNEVRDNLRQSEDLRKIQDTIASQDALNAGTFAVNSFLKDDNERIVDAQKVKNIFVDTARGLGYEPMMRVDDDGATSYGVRLKNGEIKDITPNFLNILKANLKEIGGSLLGVGLASVTKNPTSLAVGRSLLVNPASRALAYSVAGSGGGAASDYIDNSQKTGNEITAGGIINSTIGGMANDVLGAGIAEAISPVAKNSIKITGKALDKTIDLMPFVKMLREQNYKGAEKELIEQMGGREAYDEFNKLANEMGTRVNVADGSYIAGVAKEGLENASKAIDEFDPQKPLMQKGKEIAKEATGKAGGLVDKAQNVLLKGEDIAKAQSDFITAARGNERVAQIASGSLSQNPTAANMMREIITKDANKILDELDNSMVDVLNTKNVAKAYSDRVGQEFGEAIGTLERTHQGISTSIPKNEAGDQFLAEIDVLKNNVWGGVPNAKLKNILANLESGRSIDISGVNTLRSELNRIISGTTDNNVKYIANNVKKYVEGDILDDILNKTPFAAEAKQLYKKAVSEYRDMMKIKDSKWYGKVLDDDIGDNSINVAIEKTLAERAPNNSADLFLSKLSEKEAKSIELNLIRKVVDEATATMEANGKVIDINRVLKTIERHNFKSNDAKNFVSLLERLKPLIGQDIELAKAIGAFKKGEKLSQGISPNPITRIYTMMANRTIKTALRLAPIIGRQPALMHHIEQALLKAKGYQGFINNLEKIADDFRVPEGIRTEINSFLKTVRVEKEFVKGDNFTMSKEGKITYLDQIKFELDEVLKKETGIEESINASLAWLKSRHPDMFKNKRAVKELIDYVLDSPNVVKQGDSPNSSYIGKVDDNKVKDIVVDKSENKIIHANRRRMSKEERDRWQGRPPSLHTDTMPARANGADARSSISTESIISQITEKADELTLSDLDKMFIKAYPNVKESFLKNKLKAQRVEKLKKELLNPKTSWKRKAEIVNQIKKELV